MTEDCLFRSLKKIPSVTKKLGTLNAFLSETGKLFANIQGCNEGGRIPRAPKHYWGVESLRRGSGWLRRAPKSTDNVTSTFLNRVHCFRKTSVSNMGRQKCFLPWAPSNLVTPLLTYKCFLQLFVFTRCNMVQLRSLVLTRDSSALVFGVAKLRCKRRLLRANSRTALIADLNLVFALQASKIFGQF